MNNVAALSDRPLRLEGDIIRQWGGVFEPLVSVCCSTYNHRQYLEDAIRSFLAQETSFPFEIIIRDDASTDGAVELISDYARRYPNIIRALINEENHFNFERAIHVWPSVARGEYIALCEGDDFWTDSEKLQKQVDLMEQYAEATMCVALTHFYKQEQGSLRYLETTPALDKVLLDFDDIQQNYFHTSTYLIRADIFKEVIENYFAGHCLFGDTALRTILIVRGPFVLLPDVVSVYRLTGKGIWSSLDTEEKVRWRYDATKKLVDALPGRYGVRLYANLYLSAKSLFKFYLEEGRVFDAIRVLPKLAWYRFLRKLVGMI